MTTQTEALKLALEALTHGGCPPDCKDGMTDSGGVHPWGEAALIPCPNCQTISAIKEALAQPDPVAMKFKIYKPTVPDPLRQDINNALLPWVYDQDRNFGFDATMWVTPVATLPPQRKPLTNDAARKLWSHIENVTVSEAVTLLSVVRATEAAHGIKE